MKNLSIRHGKSSGNKSVLLLTVLALGTGFSSLSAQTNAASDQITAQPAADRIVPFRLREQGVVRPVEWGLDTAWEDEGNIRRGQGFMETVDIVRVSFRPTDPIVDGDLGADQKEHQQPRLGLLGFVSPKPKLAINSDHPKIDDSYKGNAQAWAQMMDLHTRYFQDTGYEVISVAPFNEPDYTYTGQGTREDFYKIAVELRANPRFKNIRICGGNTLNCDEALPWYNYLKEQLDEGNTHQLAGEFNGYAAFYETVRKDGKMAMNDEMHNVMEAMVRSMPVVNSARLAGVENDGHILNIVLIGRQLLSIGLKMAVRFRLLEAFRNVRLKRQLIVLYPKRRMCSMMVMVRSVSSTWRCPEEILIRTMNSGMPNGWSILLGEKIFSR